MKKVALLLFLIVAKLCVSQTDSSAHSEEALEKALQQLINANIQMDVDSALYPIHQGNYHVSEKPQATIMAVVVPQIFENAKNKITGGIKEKNLKVLQQSEFEDKGKKIAFTKTELTQGNTTMIVETYVISYTSAATIIVTGVCLKANEKRFEGCAKKAALSALVKSN